MFRKSRRIIFFVVIAMLLMFPGSAFPNVISVLYDLSADLRLYPPPGINLNAQGLSLAVFQGTLGELGNSNKIKLAGTYNYRVTSNPTSLFYGATKLIYITQDQIDNEVTISM